MDCVNQTLRVFRKENSMLWNCKMRFGKTVTAYALIKKAGYQKVIVVTTARWWKMAGATILT